MYFPSGANAADHPSSVLRRASQGKVAIQHSGRDASQALSNDSAGCLKEAAEGSGRNQPGGGGLMRKSSSYPRPAVGPLLWCIAIALSVLAAGVACSPAQNRQNTE